MPTARRTSCQRLSVALFLAMASGAAMAAGSLKVSSSRAGSTLSLDGQAFHQTSGAVLSPRIVNLPGGAIAALWSERAANGSVQQMYGIALNGVTFDIVRPADYTLGMHYAQFDPVQHVPQVPQNLQAGAGNELYIVQYVVPPYQAMSEAVTGAGGTVERYLPQLAQVVRMTPEAMRQVSALPFVRWVGAYHPAYRVSPEVFQTLSSAEDAPSRYSIETMRVGPAQQGALSALVAEVGGQVNMTTPDQYRMEATLTPQQLLRVISRNEVNFVDPWGGPGGMDMDLIRQQGGAVPTLSTAGFLGQGVRGEIFDTGVVQNHQQWNGQAPLTHLATTVNNHGNACYGINFATGTGNAQATGLLPQREQGIFCWYTSVSQFGGATSRLTANTQAVDPTGNFRSSYQTSSVGSAQVSQYTTLSAETDDYLFRVDYLSCQSQSNTGSTLSRPQAWAKNILSVGGMDPHENLNFLDDTFPGASFGPAQDGRIKPELCNAYLNVFTTYTTSATGYGQFSGTSSATPITAGHFGLMMQMWHEGVWAGFGGGSTVFSDRPQSATSKALMVSHARQYNFTASGTPANQQMTRGRQGFGVAHVGNLYNNRNKTMIVNETDRLTALQSKVYNLTVASGEPELKITMVYKDPQGNPGTPTQHRINNVDLKVTSPSGQVYWGNNGLMTALYNSVGGSPNTKDTVENVFVQNPAAGGWTVEVIAAEVVADGYLGTAGVNDVAYGLVASGVTVASCYPDCNGDGGLNLSDFGCFTTQFALGAAYADCNGDGVRGLADFGCFTTKFALGCP